MPKQTFFNLPMEKRKKIEGAALEEFAAKDYRDVYVTAIISQAGIADGSFYQYFENKKDLFLYLLETLKQEKISFMQSRSAKGFPREEGFPGAIKTALFTGMLFGLESPLHMRFQDRILESPLKDEAVEQVGRAALDYWKGLVVKGIAEGELREDIPVVFMSRALAAASIELSRYVVDESGLREFVGKPEDSGRLEQELWKFAEQFYALFWDGIRKRQS